MENQLLLYTILVSLFFIFWRKKQKTKNLPPGPWKLPIIGNMHQLLSALPHRRLADLTKIYGPIMHLQLGQVSNVVISSPELAKEVLKTHDMIFSSRPFNLTESVVNLSKMLPELSFCITARATVGKVLSQGDAFTLAILKITSLLGGFNIAESFPSIKLLQTVTGIRSKLQKVHEEVDAILEVITKEHRENYQSKNIKEDDLVDVCLKLQDSDELGIPFTKQDIKAVILDMLIGGTDTSSARVEWIISELIKHPKILQRVQAEVRQVCNGCEVIDETRMSKLTYLNLVIQETLRLHSPAPLLVPRKALETVELCGYKIPKNTRILINAHALARDPNYWIEPEKFYPERFLNSSVNYKGNNYEYIPFGAGCRICPGLQFGVTVVEIVIANLLYHFEWKIPDDMKIEDIDMTEDFGIVVRRRNDLLVIPIPYNCEE